MDRCPGVVVNATTIGTAMELSGSVISCAAVEMVEAGQVSSFATTSPYESRYRLLISIRPCNIRMQPRD